MLQLSMEELRSKRRDIPAKPKGDGGESPTKPFGTIIYPTKDELLRRQERQMHLNDAQPSNTTVSILPM